MIGPVECSPLAEELDGRNDDQGAGWHLLEGHQGHDRLAGASWQHHDPSAAAGQPGAQRLALVDVRAHREMGLEAQAVRFELFRLRRPHRIRDGIRGLGLVGARLPVKPTGRFGVGVTEGQHTVVS